MIIFKAQHSRQAVLREIFHQERGKICQLQHALDVSGTEAEGIANLLGCFALLHLGGFLLQRAA